MSVSFQTLYAQSCIDLAKSIIIKSEATARAINKQDAILDHIYELYYYNPYDEKTWRYYHHLSGRYHPLDGLQYFKHPQGKIRVLSIDTLEEIDFTVENLRDHRATWAEYQKGSTYYQNLVNKYPKLVKLIDGILNPIDIDKAINAPDYTILQWDKRHVEGNELSLMENIQKEVNLFFHRYDNPDYEKTDNLYIPAKIGIFYLYLPSIIMKLRYNAARSIEAHSFHVWSYLGSHQFLDEYREHLNLYQRLWFYRNVNWVEINAGKTETFEKLIDVVMTNRQLPIAEFETMQKPEMMEEDNTIMYPDVQLARLPLNMHDTVTQAGNVKTIEEAIDKEVPDAKDNRYFVDDDKHKARKRLTRSAHDGLSTKMLESFATDNSKRQPIRLGDVELNEWIYMTTQGLYTANISVVNPKTSDIFNFTQQEALIVFVYSLIRSYGFNPTWIPTIYAQDVLKRRKPLVKDVLKHTDKIYTDPIYVYAIDYYVPPVEKIISTSKFSEFCNLVWETRKIHRNIYSFTKDYRTHAQVKSAILQHYTTVECTLIDGKVAFLDYFKRQGWELDGLSDKDYAKLANEITRKSLGTDLVKRYSLREVQGMMVRLLKQLSSYSIQFLRSINEEDVVVADWGYLRVHGGTGRDELGQHVYNEVQTNITTVNVRYLTMRTFHWDQSGIIQFPLRPINVKQLARAEYQLVDKTREDGSIDDENLILTGKIEGLMKAKVRSRMPSVGVYEVVGRPLAPPTVAPEPEVTWDLDQFRIHKTTEDRSRVIVDEHGNLITRGIVYVKKDYKGKK